MSRTLRLLEECLIGSGVAAEEAGAAISSFRTVREFRNVVKGHAAGTKRRELEKRMLIAHGSFRAHFASLAADCDNALDVVMRGLGTQGADAAPSEAE